MRTWGEWTSREREIFVRVHRDDREVLSLLNFSDLSEVKAYVDVEMFVRPLEENEIDRVNHILDAAVAKPIGGGCIDDGLNEAGRFYLSGEGSAKC